MDNEQILKLLMEIGPESSNAFGYWIGMELFRDVTATFMGMLFFYLLFRVFKMILAEVGMDRDLQKVRALTDPGCTGQMTSYEIRQMLSTVTKWKEQASKIEDYEKLTDRYSELATKYDKLVDDHTKYKSNLRHPASGD